MKFSTKSSLYVDLRRSFCGASQYIFIIYGMLIDRPDAKGPERLPKASSFDTKSKVFRFRFLAADLSDPGEYLIWVNSWNDGALSVKYTSTEEKYSLPTKHHPFKLTVNSSAIKKIIAAVLALFTVIALGAAFMYARKNPGKIVHVAYTTLQQSCAMFIQAHLAP